MKILTIGNFGFGWDGSICDEEHIAGALEKLGHEVIRSQRETAVNVAYFERWPGAQEDVDFILVAQWDGFFESLYQQLRLSHKCPIVYWAFDYQADGQEWHERLVRGADLYLSKRIADSKYPNWQWLSQDFAPSFLDKWDEPISMEKYESPYPKDIDVLFTGSYLDWATERNETLKAVDEKFNLVIHSVNEWPGFKDRRGPIMDDGLPALYARAKIILSIDHTIEAGYWSDRNAQIMACRGLVLFRYVPLSEVRFAQGTHIPFYDKDDCLYQISQLLEMHEEDLEAMREVGYRWSKVDLKVEHRVSDLLTIVENIL